jgi:hypothetical protein
MIFVKNTLIGGYLPSIIISWIVHNTTMQNDPLSFALSTSSSLCPHVIIQQPLNEFS